MKGTLEDIDTSHQKKLDLILNNNEKRREFIKDICVFYSFLQKNGTPEYNYANPLIHSALRTLNVASSLILGLEEEIKTEIERGGQSTSVFSNVIAEKSKLNEALKESVSKLNTKYIEQKNFTEKVIIVAKKSIKTKELQIKEEKANGIESRKGIVKGGKSSCWKSAENHILEVLGYMVSTENQLKQKDEKMTHRLAIIEIEKAINDGRVISESTFGGWLKKYKKSGGDRIFD
jgi:hypothetical protein